MKKSLMFAALAMLFFSCASDSQKDIEQAQFYLDQGDFAKAIALADPIVTAEPSNNQAKFILSSALIGDFALSKKAGCKKTDTGYLGLLACLLDTKDSGDTNGLQSFERIAPKDNSDFSSIDRSSST